MKTNSMMINSGGTWMSGSATAPLQGGPGPDGMNTGRGRRFSAIVKVLIVALMAGGAASCESTGEGEPAKDYAQFRLNNESDAPMTLWVGGELRVTAAPGQLKSTRAPEGLVEVSVRTTSGNVLWTQMADVPLNAFAQYNVKPDLSVILTAGNIATPYEVGSNKEQVKLANEASFPVEFLIDGAVVGAVGPYLYATYNVPRDTITIAFRHQGGGTLFSQTVDVPRNAFFAYTVLPNGNVIATGGEVQANIQEQFGPYYYGY
jgi:hypothetical protein